MVCIEISSYLLAILLTGEYMKLEKDADKDSFSSYTILTPLDTSGTCVEWDIDFLVILTHLNSNAFHKGDIFWLSKLKWKL